MDDHALLQEYVQRRSEQAFAELVRRHVNLVYSTAARLAGEPHLAEDVAQAVFLQLARKAGTVRNGRALGSWLYRVTRAATVDALRSEQRRRIREREAMSRAEQSTDGGAAWSSVSPLLDEAMRRLKPAEVDAVVLRFFEGKSLREVGDALALSEDGAQKRVGRALEKMRAYFAKRGVKATAAALTAVIATNSVQAAPTGLAEKFTATSLAGAGGSGAAGVLGKIFGLGAKFQAAGAAALMVGAAIPLIWQFQENARLRAEVTAAQQENNHWRHVSGAQSDDDSGGLSMGLTDAEIEAHIQEAVRTRLTGSMTDRESYGVSGSPWYGDWVKFLSSIKAAEMPRVLAHVERAAYKETRLGLRAVLVAVWAKSDVHAAMACAMAIPASEEYNARAQAMRNVMDEWVKQDLSAAEAFVGQLPVDGTRDYLVYPLARELAPKDPQAAFDLVKNLSSHGGGRAGGLENSIFLAWDQVMGNWPQTDFPNAGQQVETLPFTDRFYALEKLAGNWAAVDPAAAAAWGAAISDGRDKSEFVNYVFSTWAEKDHAGALNAAEQLTDPGAQKAALATIISSWMHGDPEGAMTYVQNMPSGPLRDSVLGTISQSMNGGDREAMSTAVAELPDGQVRDAAVLKLVRSWAADSVNGGTNAILDAAAWSAALPDDTLRASAYDAIMESWSHGDPAAAEQWITTLPADKARDQAVYAFAAYVGQNFPAEAGRLAETMAKSSGRGIALYNAGFYWLQQDRPAATAWITQSTLLSDKDKKRLLGSN